MPDNELIIKGHAGPLFSFLYLDWRLYKFTKMNRLLILLLMMSSVGLYAQVMGTVFPAMDVETINDEAITLPDEVKGKYTLLGLAYSKRSEDELNTWFKPIFEKFLRKDSGGLFAGFGYDVNVYFIPMFTGINAAAAGTAKRKAVDNIDPQLQPYILFYKGDLKPYKEALDFEKRDTPYFYVLDPEGKIRYATSGAYSDKKMDQVESVLE